MSALLALGWFFHPMNGLGYQFWSGIGSDIGEVAILGGIVTLVRHRTCHVDGCWRLGHIDPNVHHPACKRHHSHSSKLGRARGH